MTSPIEICERLAALGRAGYPLRRAVIELSRRLDCDDPAIASAARRAHLGFPIERCLEPLSTAFGPAYPRLATTLGSTGLDWTGGLDELADSLRRADASKRAAALAGSGATLSARTIAVLPLLMAPVAVKQLGDPTVAVSVAVGLLLGAVGYRWLVRSIPAPPSDDPVAAVADEVAASLRAGASVDRALRAAVRAHPHLAGSARKVDLGATWAEALATPLPAIARALSDARLTGAPLADTLNRTAEEIRSDAAHGFERKVERAPIKMVVPLACCILPSFVLVAIVPLLRGLG